jgi:membrane protein DedA with SNARE-associated domain
MHDVIATIQHFIMAWGYWAVAGGLLLENAGVPVPGETILIIASVTSFHHSHELRLPWIIVVATIAATTGDNIGYWIGRRGGRPLLDKWKRFFRIQTSHIESGEKLIEKHGPVAIFFARFVAGARIVAGPLAGVLHMSWEKFALFNFLGAITWVTVIAVVAHQFGGHLHRVLVLIKGANLAILIVLAIAILLFWYRHRRR